MIQVDLKSEKKDKTEFYDQIAKDSKQALIQLLSEAGHGKTSSLRTIIQHVKNKYPEITFKIFDVSQAWYHCAPTQWRQLVTTEKINKRLVANIPDCVYEIGSLSQLEKRAFVGEIIGRDWMKRYQAKLQGKLEEIPLIAFVFEESNIYFGSYSFRKNDIYSPIFQNYVSVGRNFKMRGFLVATAEQGEMAPSIRRRSRKIYGKLESEADLAVVRRKDKELAKYLKEIPRYHFIYYSGKVYGPVRIPDIVTHTPTDYVVDVPEKEPNKFTRWWWIKFLFPFLIVLMFYLYLRGL